MDSHIHFHLALGGDFDAGQSFRSQSWEVPADEGKFDWLILFLAVGVGALPTSYPCLSFSRRAM